jgi:hypothetical protein
MSNSNEISLDEKKQIAFEQARLDYCSQVFEREEQRREILEKKSQFYLSFVTLLLGAIFLKADFIKELNDLTTQKQISSFVLSAMYIFGIALAISLLFTFIMVLMSVKIQSYKSERPNNLTFDLFAPDSTYIDRKDEISIISATAKSYSIAADHNARVNKEKARWVHMSSFGVFASVTSLALFLSVLALILLG